MFPSASMTATIDRREQANISKISFPVSSFCLSNRAELGAKVLPFFYLCESLFRNHARPPPASSRAIRCRKDPCQTNLLKHAYKKIRVRLMKTSNLACKLYTPQNERVVLPTTCFLCFLWSKRKIMRASAMLSIVFFHNSPSLSLFEEQRREL